MKSFGKVKYRRYAFTLAEVLITITVIGVVAALTIPNLVNNYQNRAWSTASVVFQRKLGEALKVMNSQGTLAGYSSTEDFVNELSKHIKINKICKNDEITSCFEDTVFWGNDNKEIDMKKIKLAANLGHSEWITNTLGVMFADGVSGIIAYNPECSQDPYRTDVINVSDTGIGTNCIALLYDTSGFKKPNTQSKDLRGLNVLSLDGESCVIQLSDGTCYTTAAIYKVSIEECRQMADAGYGNNKNYCSIYNPDYWAGAVKGCKDQGYRLPTDAELKKLAELVYQDINGNFAGNRNNEQLLSAGLINNANETLTLWFMRETSGSGSGARYFYANNTISTNRARGASTSAVCISN